MQETEAIMSFFVESVNLSEKKKQIVVLTISEGEGCPAFERWYDRTIKIKIGGFERWDIIQ